MANDRRSQEGWRNRREWATLLFVVATTIGVFIQACILHNSDRAFQTTATAAREANEINIRPYIKTVILPETFAIKPSSASGKSAFAVQFQIEDIGKLPADARIQAVLGWEMEGRDFVPKNFLPNSNVGQIFLFPQQDSGSFNAFGPDLSDGQINDLKSAKFGRAEVWISVLYGPGNDVGRYETSICSSYPIKFDGSIFSLGKGQRCPRENSNYAK